MRFHFYLGESFIERVCIFFARILTITAWKIVCNIKSTKNCNFYCGPQPVVKEKPQWVGFSSKKTGCNKVESWKKKKIHTLTWAFFIRATQKHKTF